MQFMNSYQRHGSGNRAAEFEDLFMQKVAGSIPGVPHYNLGLYV